MSLYPLISTPAGDRFMKGLFQQFFLIIFVLNIPGTSQMSFFLCYYLPENKTLFGQQFENCYYSTHIYSWIKISPEHFLTDTCPLNILNDSTIFLHGRITDNAFATSRNKIKF